ncbi:MAG: calcium-translocating P-type ATPase, PMCA-type [Burkholderiales bacterium]|nr:calcium-translocating P-type ATPase, PMCA-type [Burkholderiales bacterium]
MANEKDVTRTGPPAKAAAVHHLTAEEVAANFDVQINHGLPAAQVEQRLRLWGTNQLQEAPDRSPWTVFFAQFKSLLILILMGAALLAGLMGNTKDALVILAVVVINATVGFYQEYRAEQSLSALKGMLPLRARVRRDGNKVEVSAEALVPGDIVLLEAGDQVPADGRLVLAAGVEIDESALTGESLPVAKHSGVINDPAAPLAERVNMAYMNTLLTRGRAEMIVTATGIRTEMGSLSQELAAAAEAPTPLQIQLDQLGKRLGLIAITLVGVLSLMQFFRGDRLSDIVLDAIALAVAAMPEGLPVVVTVTLALGMRNMARHRAIVKRLSSVETLGCTTVICTDKTGTLTLNQMTARAFIFRGHRFNVSGEGYQTTGDIRPADSGLECDELSPMLVPLVACNDSRLNDGKAVGDPMEAALLALAHKGGIADETVHADFPRIAEIPFDAANKFMATFHRTNDRITMFVKGAPDILLSRCTRCLDNAGTREFESQSRQKIESEYGAFADQGLRGLLIASREVPAHLFKSEENLLDWVDDLTFIGLVGLMDPPRPEAKIAIAQCREAGIAVKVITGDHHLTASSIAAELGLQGKSITGAELDGMDANQIARAINEVTVFARVTPAHKVNIVRLLQKQGHVVAMTGDGVNDAPALKSADIGVAMGITGTAVAKEAATMVLTDDNFATLVSAVKQGRALYDNILKFVRFQLSTTIGAILTVFFAPLAGLPEPFTAIQILWVAIIMDGPPAVSLALDAARPNIMSDAPRNKTEAVLPFSRIGKIIAFGLTMMVGTLSVLYYGMHNGSKEWALTLAFTTFVLFQVFNVFNARIEHGTAFNRRFFENRMLWLSLIAVVVLQAVAVHWEPAQEIFGTRALSLSDWAIAVSVAAAILFLEEGRKLIVLASRKIGR